MRWLATFGLVSAIGFGGCGGSGATSPGSAAATSSVGRPQVITIQASDYAFQMPPTIVSGLVTFQVKNSGQEPHNFSLLKLKDGVAVEQGMAAATKGDRRSLAAETVSSGGVASISSEVSGETTVSLAPGNYLVVCQVAGADGVPHMMKGMAMPVQVTAPSAAASISPRTAGTLTLKDFAFDVPATLSKGNTYQVTNQGPQTHEMEVVKLDSGKTVSDLPAFFASDRSGRPPFQELGGAAAVGPGDSNSYWTIDVPPGNYVFICQVGDPVSGKPHAALGMIKAVTVQ